MYVSRVMVTGIYRATPLRVNPRQRTVKAVYKTYIDVIHFRKADDRRLRGREEEEGDEGEGEGQKKTFTAERIEQLKQLSKTPDVYERLSRALGRSDMYMHGHVRFYLYMYMYMYLLRERQLGGFVHLPTSPIYVHVYVYACISS